MVKTSRWGIDAWVEYISTKELPALSSTVRLLENLAKDDTMSLAKVGQSVLHDYALTSTILKVANSSAYMGRSPVTTVSRAAVVLGFNTIKNICITARLLGTMLKSKNLTESAYDRLLKQMAQSFHAGMLTQMMMVDYDENTREEIFIAALLRHLGESAFWCSGGISTEEVIERLERLEKLDKSSIDKVTLEVLGTTFEKMTIALAKSWNLGEHIIRTMEEPDLKLPETRIVTLADRLSSMIANPQQSGENFTELLSEFTKLTGLSEKKAKEKIEVCLEDTEKMLSSYGADILIQYLHPGGGAGAVLDQKAFEEPLSDEALQLQILRELTFLTVDRGDFNVVIQTTLEGIYRGIGMDRVMVLLRSNNKRFLEPRFISAPDAEQVKSQFNISLQTMENIFSHAYFNRQSVWVKDFDDEQFGKLLSKPIRNITSKDGFFLAPIMWDNHCIGLFYADRQLKKGHKRGKLEQKDYNAFTHFTQQSNLCLSMILKRSN